MCRLNTSDSQTPITASAPSLNGVYISTYGCQMNENDTERMYSLLEMANFSPVTSPEQADLIIINSCSVREKPVHKVHSEVGRYRKLKLRNPNLKIGVGGCVGQQEKSKLTVTSPLIDFVFGPDNIDELPQIVQKAYSGEGRVIQAKFYNNEPYHIENLVRNPGISTFINITKGCDNFCTFCVVPFTRGRLRSRPASDIVKDVTKLVEKGVKEVTLLGQNVNSYMGECGTNFANLLKKLSDDTDILRIRYITSHPKDFTEELCQVHRDYREKVCDYIHLPVQSGNTEVLHRMNRVYSREEYMKKIEMIYKYVPSASLSSDFIVGFPGETEEQFLDTLSIIKEARYETLYAFKYSPRPFTKAARFTDAVPEHVMDDRLTRLLAFYRETAFELSQAHVGKTVQVLVEKENSTLPGGMTGRSTQNKVVHFNGTPDLIGKLVDVKVTTAFPQTFHGDRIS